MKDKFATKIGGRRMEYMVNKQLGCVDVILKNGLFRKTSYGDCIFKSESGEIDKFTRTANMTDEKYNEEFMKFCSKHNVNGKKVLELLE
ncbi:hypothetical protein ACTFIN_00270 [Clostridium cagae]|uniref:Uncharacterized protein n=1 Tax=Clostridium botulinum (strain Eklund 17B / Type B) TaxID=935198 RepID=B2TP54_CLOBB|nr:MULTISPECIES: hypothetical protein [Clostridium]ACD22482.1 hypothetical protein CLL_A2824 [Clostridium botulinum B str. Eklund 17B (NRP)]AIY80069.1 hypothetical protein U728_1739 [Clostridium botulinum 202F]KAI3347918.1 hypothetical protein CIT17_06590 [Clostridium botulinum]MBZ9692457.1 hypothetical protein [Clostridium sp. M14]MCR1273509.1 hypothetical protein [Clostridium botulinum]